MSQPARVSNTTRQKPNRSASPHPAMRVAVLRVGRQAALCAIRRVSACSVQIELILGLERGERVSLRAGDGETVTGTVAWCKQRVAEINLDSPLATDALLSLSADNDAGRRRSFPRVEAAARVRLKSNRRTIEARLHNISATGARVSTTKSLSAGAPILLTLPDFGDLHGCVCWSNAREAGLRFDAPIPVDALAKWLNSRIRVSYQE